MSNGTGDHPEREIQRELAQTSPLMQGPDVKELQDSINKTLTRVKLHGQLKLDGEFGEHTLSRAAKTAFALGFSEKDVERINGNHVSKQFQLWIRNPESRSDNQTKREPERVKELVERERRESAGARAAVKYARSKLHVTEQPLGSNRGPLVDEWTKFCGLTPPVFWCGCFAAYCAVHEGKAKVLAGNLINNERIAALARAGTAGLHAVAFSEARAGDIVSYNFAHIGLIVGASKDGRLHTIEGNTGEMGLQNNGGGVYEHTDRTAANVLAIARPDYS
jgi:hypothetical protein